MRTLWRRFHRRFVWRTRCDDCGRRLFQTDDDERECIHCNVIFPDYSSPFYRDLYRKIQRRERERI